MVEKLQAMWYLWGWIVVRDVAMMAAVGCSESEAYLRYLWIRAMVFNASAKRIPSEDRKSSI
jgi:hypothetical protein